jgi:hypothetical protein
MINMKQLQYSLAQTPSLNLIVGRREEIAP